MPGGNVQTNTQLSPEQAGFQWGTGGSSRFHTTSGMTPSYYKPGSMTGRTLGQLQSNGYLDSQNMMDQLLGANWGDYNRDMHSQKFNWEQNQQAINKVSNTASKNAQGIRDWGTSSMDQLMGIGKQIEAQGVPFADEMREWGRKGADSANEWADRANATMEGARKGFEDDSAQQASMAAMGNQRDLESRKTNNLLEAGGAFGQTSGQLEENNRLAERDSQDRNTQQQAQIFSQYNQSKAQLGAAHADLQSRLGQITSGAQFGAGSLAGQAANVASQFAGIQASLSQAALASKTGALALAAELEQQGLQSAAQFTMANPFAPTSIFDAMMRGAAVATTPGYNGGQLFAQHGGFNLPKNINKGGMA